MGRRTLVEGSHLIVGLALTAVIFAGAGWAYPVGRETILWVGWGTAAVVLAMGAGPLRRAWREDRERIEA